MENQFEAWSGLNAGTGLSFYDLSVGFQYMLTDAVQLLLLRYASGLDVPEFVLSAPRQGQWKWGDDGELFKVSSEQSGVTAELWTLLIDDRRIKHATHNPITLAQLERLKLIKPDTKNKWSKEVLFLLCFVCSPDSRGESRL